MASATEHACGRSASGRQKREFFPAVAGKQLILSDGTLDAGAEFAKSQIADEVTEAVVN